MQPQVSAWTACAYILVLSGALNANEWKAMKRTQEELRVSHFEAPNQTLHRSEEDHENFSKEMQTEEGFPKYKNMLVTITLDMLIVVCWKYL